MYFLPLEMLFVARLLILSLPNCIYDTTGHSSFLVPSTTTSDSPAQQGFGARGRMLDWKDPVGSSENTNSYVAVSSHNHQDKKGKALEIILPVVGREEE